MTNDETHENPFDKITFEDLRLSYGTDSNDEPLQDPCERFRSDILGEKGETDNDAPDYSGFENLTLDDSSSPSKAAMKAWSDLYDVIDNEGNIIHSESETHNDDVDDDAGDERNEIDLENDDGGMNSHTDFHNDIDGE